MRNEIHNDYSLGQLPNGETVKEAIAILQETQKIKEIPLWYKWLDILLTAIYLLLYIAGITYLIVIAYRFLFQ